MDSIRIKRGLSKDLPTNLPLGELAFCTDTQELWVGTGSSTPLKKVKDSELEKNLEQTNAQLSRVATSYYDSTNFKILSNSTIILTESLTLDNMVEFRNVQNVHILCNIGKVTITCNDSCIFHILHSENITFENIIFNFTRSIEGGWGAVVAQQKANNINFINCDFITERANGFSAWCNDANYTIENINFENCEFSTGRMGIEFVNHIDDGTRRYSNITVNNCNFSDFGRTDYPMGISLSGYGEGCKIQNNTFHNTNAEAIGIEVVGCCYSVFENNNFKGKFVYFSVSNDRVMNDLTFKNNKMLEDYSNINCYFKNMINSTISNNKFGYTRIVNCTNVTVNNNFINSSLGSAIIFDNSIGCKSYNNYYSTYYAPSNSVTMSFYGTSCSNNISEGDELVRSSNAGGVYFSENNGANNNLIQLYRINNNIYPYSSPLDKLVKKEIVSRSVTFTIRPEFDGTGERVGGILNYTFVLCNKDDNNTQSVCINGLINYHLLLDPVPFLPQINQIISNEKIEISVSRNIRELVLTLVTTDDTLTNCVGIFTLKSLGAKNLIAF